MAEVDRRIVAKVEALQRRYQRRDHAAMLVRAARRGDWEEIAPGAFPAAWPRPVVANIIDVMARDFAAKLSPLPAFNCTGSNSLSIESRKFNDKRTKIANGYVTFSRLQPQMVDGADAFNSYGLMVVSVEPDFKKKMPRMVIEDGAAVYPVWNRNMDTIAVAKVYYRDAQSVIAEYPHIEPLVEQNKQALVQDSLKLVKWCDDTQCIVYLPDLGNEIIEQYRNPLGECTYVCVPRPTGSGVFSMDIRGAYDDHVWQQIARNEFQLLAMEAADKAVRAPIVHDVDVTEVSFGPDATLATRNPQGVQRLKVDVPPASFQAMEWLRQDMQLGGMSPEARTGNTSASVITGRGVQELMEGYSTQIALAQDRIGFALERAIQLCFKMDETYWPNQKKDVRGVDNGAPYEVSYTPKKDIAGDHSIDVQYGFLAGLDANRALVYVLQARGDSLVSRDFAMRQLPANINVNEESKKIKLEKLEDSMLNMIEGAGQAVPAMAAQGQDPGQMIRAIATAYGDLSKGKEIDKALLDAFAPPSPPANAPGSDEAAEGEPPAPGGPPGSEPGAAAGGTPMGAAPMGGGRPPLQQLFAGLGNNGQPNLQSGVSRQIPAT